jgi:hypothetical protein
MKYSIACRWGSGSRTSHHALLLWYGDELYVCESCYTSCPGTTRGVQKTLYAEWIAAAYARNATVAWLPLAPQLRCECSYVD